MVVALAFAMVLQDKPVEVPKGDLPRSSVCAVCMANGESHGEERPQAGLRYKGTTYYFCSKKEVETFKKDPDAFLPPVLPRPMPAFDLTDVDGKHWTAESFKGTTILVDFWATWCGPCKEMKPIVEKVREKFAGKGFEVLSVSIDEKKADLLKFLPKNKFANPVLHDSSQTWAAWKVRVVPAFYLVKDGQVVAQWVGKFKQDVLEKAVGSAIIN